MLCRLQKRVLILASVIFTSIISVALAADDSDTPWVSLFNGKDLSGWVPIDVAPSTFRVRDGVIVSSGFPTGLLRTARQYENFVIELEWRHMKPGGNAGLFVWGDGLPAVGTPFARGMEVQILDNGFNAKGKNEWYTTHGDVFPVQGAKMTPTGRISSTGQRSFPTEERSKSSPEWNHYRVEGNNGVLKLSVNGKEVSVGKDCSPRKGYLCLESEGSECQFRNIRIHELPSTNPSPDEIADPAEGFVPLYNGVDLSGWKMEAGHENHWQSKDWILAYDGKSSAADPNLWTEKEYGDLVLVCDWRWTRKPEPAVLPVILPSGEQATSADGTLQQETVPNAGDSGIYLRGSSKSQVNMWCWPVGSGEVYGYRTDPQMSPEVRARRDASCQSRPTDRPMEPLRYHHARRSVDGRPERPNGPGECSASGRCRAGPHCSAASRRPD